LAGLIEGDGSISVPSSLRSAKGIKRYPYIKIVFHINDYPLAVCLQKQFGGTFLFSKGGTYLGWRIFKEKEVFAVCKTINGYFRTPKIEALHNIIVYFNQSEKVLTNTDGFEKLPFLGLDQSPLESNSWLSGFTDADGHFGLSVYTLKGRKKMRANLIFKMELQQVSQFYTKSTYLDICSKIATLFQTKVKASTRTRDGKKYFSYVITTTNKNSNKLVLNYFEHYPLFSSKFLNYKDWRELLLLQESHNGVYPSEYFDKALITRANFNSTRTTFDWSHLDYFYRD